MSTYSEMVKKARELHKTLGESEFRNKYEGNPSLLAEHIGAGGAPKQRAQHAKEVLEAFRFYPLAQRRWEILERILEMYGKHPLPSTMLGDNPRNLRVLEERGAIRLAKVKGWRGMKLMVTEVFDEKAGAWRKAVVPKPRESLRS